MPAGQVFLSALSGPVLVCLALGAAHAVPAHASGKAKPRAESKVPSAGRGKESLREHLKARLAEKRALRTDPAPEATLKPGEFTFVNRYGKRYVLGPGADLRNADLRGGDFRDRDLRGADLRDARLGEARLSGTRFQGARLVMTDLSRATGVDLTGARLHPFFETWGREPVGTVKLIDLYDAESLAAGYPRNLQVLPDGGIFWLQGTHNNLYCLPRTGCDHQIGGGEHKKNDTRLFALAKDTHNRLWSFGDQATRHYRMPTGGPEPEFSVLAASSVGSLATTIPNNASAGPGDSVWLTFAQQALWHCRFLDRIQIRIMEYPEDWQASAALKGVATPDGERMVFIGPHQDECFRLVPGEAQAARGRKSASGALHGCAYGADGRLYCAQTEPNGLGWLVWPGDEHGLIDTGAGDPCGIALGPDGAIWWTEPAANRIGRLSPERVPQYFDLPEDTHPEELVPGPDGRMYFTLRGKNRLGSIRALASPPAEETKAGGQESKESPVPDSSAGWTLPSFTRKPERISKYPKGKARTEFLDRIAREAEARFLARLAVEPELPAPGPEWYQQADDTEEKGAVETKAGAPEVCAGLEGLSPREKLAVLNVNLAPGATRHILARHGHKKKKYKSQFAPEFSSAEAIEALIADGLAAAGDALAAIQSPRSYSFDRRGRHLTLCTRKQVGCHNRYGKFKPTEKFLVVTEDCDGEDGPGLDVVTAYPVSNRW